MDSKNQQNYFNNPVVIILVIALLGLGGYLLFNKTNDNFQNTQQSEIDALKKTIENLKNQKPPQVKKENDFSTIVSQWGPRMAYIKCDFRNQNNIIYQSQSGSGTMGKSTAGEYSILTNRHVISDDNGLLASSCYVIFPQDSNTYTIFSNDMVLNPNGADAAMLNVKNPDNYIISLFSTKLKFNKCDFIPPIGESIIVLGYPLIGSSVDVTVTEGIISSYEGNYYVTSAKIDRGNSGGAAIDVKNGCYLGIPTWAATGSIESLGRIFKWQAFLTS